MTGKSRWICAQLGSREHYAIPRVLHASARLEALLTDFWAEPRWLWSSMPGSRMAPARERWHKDLAGACVRGLGLSRFLFDAVNRKPGWATLIRRNEWFQRRHLDLLRKNEPLLASGSPGVFFAYSYACRDLLRFFKRLGWKTVLGQIDPGPQEEAIVAAEAERFPEWCGRWSPAPAGYWSSWREELASADRIVVNSEWSLECLQHEGVSRDKIVVVPLAYDASLSGRQDRKPSPAAFTRERPLRVLFLGQINLRKGAHRLLQAARRLTDLPIVFDLVGPVEIAPAFDLRSNVRWRGAVSREEANRCYSGADVFILPTLSDGFALTQLEALANGLPVIATRSCGRVVEDGVNGWLLPSASSDDIVGLLTRLVSSPDEVSRCSGKAAVPERFSMRSLDSTLSSFEESFA